MVKTEANPPTDNQHEHIDTIAVPPEACCIKCGYSLVGLTTLRCPECAQPFDPDVPYTMTAPRRLRIKRSLATPPPLLFNLFFVLCTLVSLIHASSPSVSHITGNLLGIAMGTMTILWLIAFLIALPLSKYRTGKKSRWWVVPICVTILTISLVTRAPLLARFHLSRGGFENAAKKALTCPETVINVGWIGLFPIENIEVQQDVVTGNVVMFHIPCLFSRREQGFAYSPSHDTCVFVNGRRGYFQQLWEHWFTF